MPFRDDRDALLARADALDAEVARLRAAQAQASSERDAAVARLDELTAERDALQARLARLAPAAPARRWSIRWMIAAAAFVSISVGLAVERAINRPSMRPPAAAYRAAPAPAPAPTRPSTPAPAPGPTIDPVASADALIAIRTCLDTIDVRIRVFAVAPGAVSDDELRAGAETCRASLDAAAALPGPLGESVSAYRVALARIPALVDGVRALGPQPPLSDAAYDSGTNPMHRHLATPELASLFRPWRSTSALVRSSLRRPFAALAAARAAKSPRAEAVAAALELLDQIAFVGDRSAALARLRDAVAQLGDGATGELRAFLAAAERLGTHTLSPVTAGEMLELARLAEQHGYAAIVGR